MDAPVSADAVAESAAVKRPLVVWLRWSMLAVAAVFYLLHFVHLDADFPNNSPWMDWSKFTDEGWYSDAAVRHFLFGHWYLKGDFNPGITLPMWPLLEAVAFKFAGVSTYSARALAVLMFGVTLVAMYLLIERHTRVDDPASGRSLAAPLCVLMLCCSPFVYAFERMAIVEPMLIALMTLAVLAASYLRPFPYLSKRRRRKLAADPKAIRGVSFSVGPRGSDPISQLKRARVVSVVASVALGVLLPALVLTKTTALFLFPALGYMVWARAGYKVWPAVRLAFVPCILGAALWCVYFFGFVRPHYLQDYRYIFSANAYTSASAEPLYSLLVQTVGNTVWMGVAAYSLVFVVIAAAFLWRPTLFANPLLPTLLLWAVGYLLFIGYHFNMQPRYYLVIAVPLTAFVAIGVESFRHVASKQRFATVAALVCVLVVIVPDSVRQLRFVLHPEYTFRAAADGIKRIVLSDASHSHLVLSISGSDLTLMTGLPTICDDFGTLTLDERVQAYRPGWYASWNELDDDKMDALSPLFKPVRVAQFPAMDDVNRNLLILYRLDPADPNAPKRPRRTRGRKSSRLTSAQQGSGATKM